jgi:molecular chaperone Hsp33
MGTKEPAGRLVTAMAHDNTVRVLVAVLHGPAQEMCRRHGLDPAASRLASEGMVAAALLGSQIKGREQLAVNVFGEDPEFSLNVDMRDEGAVRGRIEPQLLGTAAAEPHHFRGLIAVIKHLDDEEIYRGVAEVTGGTVEDALQSFFDRSLQVDGRVRLEVQLGDDGRVEFAAGMLAERLPDLDPEDFRTRIAGPMQKDFRNLMTAFAFGQLAGAPVEVLESRELIFRCTCSHERVLSMLRALGPDELGEMLAEDGRAQVTCHFCNEVYEISGQEIEALLAAFTVPP